MENILFYFANFPVYSYGAMLGLGLLIGSCLAQQEGKRKGFGPDFIFSFVVGVALAFMLGGRIYTVYQVHGWRMILYPWVLFSGLQMDERAGGIAAGVYAIYFVLRYVSNGAAFLDVLTPPVALIQSLGYLGSSVLGRQTFSPWGVNLGEFNLHPLPLYAALIYYVVFSFLWRMRRNLRYDGQLFLGYLALSALAQRILIPFREESPETVLPWLYTLAFVVFGLVWLYLFTQAPLTDMRRRRDLRSWRSWVAYLVSLMGVGFLMMRFFYWRFS